MKHQKKGRKLGRERNARTALFKSLIFHLVKYGKIETTEARAKEIRPKIEKLVTRARIKNLASRRVLSKVLSPLAVKKLVQEIGPKYETRKGGYTRIIKLGNRKGDGSKMAQIEFV